MSKELTQEELKRLLDYNPETGVFTRLVGITYNSPLGSEAGSIAIIGYRYICLLGSKYLAHRLAWFYVHGVWPNGEIDHINGDRADNRIGNLRVVTHAENQHNTPKAKGYYRREYGRWSADIKVNNVKIRLGTFPTEADARAAYLEAKKIYHPTAPQMKA